MQQKDGHPDFEYSRRKLRGLDIEGKTRDELIKKALDKMNHYYDDVKKITQTEPVDREVARQKRVEMLLKEESEIDEEQTQDETKEKRWLHLISERPVEKRHCPKCGSDRTMITAFRKEFEAFECLHCGHNWKEVR